MLENNYNTELVFDWERADKLHKLYGWDILKDCFNKDITNEEFYNRYPEAEVKLEIDKYARK
jgi:hypothetical protein